MSLPLDEELFAEAVARRVVELLATSHAAPATSAGPRVLTCRQVAERLGHSTDWVRDHRGELGQVPGVGARPRLLFDAEAVDRWATARDEVVESEAEKSSVQGLRRGARRTSSGSATDLLPIRGAQPIEEAA